MAVIALAASASASFAEPSSEGAAFSSTLGCASLSTVVGISAFARMTGLAAAAAIAGIGVLMRSSGESEASFSTIGNVGGGKGWNNAPCSIGVGFGRPREVITLSPIEDIWKNFGANA